RGRRPRSRARSGSGAARSRPPPARGGAPRGALRLERALDARVERVARDRSGDVRDDLAVAVDAERLRYAGCAVTLVELVAGVVDDGVGEPVVAHERARVAREILVVDPEDNH